MKYVKMTGDRSIVGNDDRLFWMAYEMELSSVMFSDS